MARPSRSIPSAALIGAALIASLASGPLGCSTTIPQGRSGLPVRYDGLNTTEVRLPDRVDPETALAIVRRVLEERGLLIRRDVRSASGGVIAAARHREPTPFDRRIGPALALGAADETGLEGLLARTGALRITVRVEEDFPGTRLRVEAQPDPTHAEGEGRAIVQQILLGAGL